MLDTEALLGDVGVVPERRCTTRMEGAISGVAAGKVRRKFSVLICTTPRHSILSNKQRRFRRKL
jgi:hypothetical protein